jgi:FtsZ-interacting cell division protein ZipA
MFDIIVAAVAIVGLVLGFFWTRSSGPRARSARRQDTEELRRYTRSGHVPEPGEDADLEPERELD